MPDFQNLFQFLLPLIAQQQQGGMMPIPSLGNIANQPYTPPTFGGQIPGIGQPQQQNPYAALEVILNNLQNQPIQQAPEPGKVQSILGALAGGLSVLGSKEPGTTLQQQFQGRQQRADALAAQKQQQQNFVNQARLQIGVQQATDIAREQQEVAKEKRTDLRTIEAEKRQYDLDIKKLKETGQITADLARKNALDDAEWYRSNRDVLNLKAEDKQYLENKQENEKAALIRATRYKIYMPQIEFDYLLDIARYETGARRLALNDSETDLYRKLSKFDSEEVAKDIELERQFKKASVAEKAALAEATKSGLRYPGQLDRFGNEISRVLAHDAAKAKSGVFMINKKTNQIMDMDDVKELPIQAGKYDPWELLPPDQQLVERDKAYQKLVDFEKERKAQKQQGGNVSTIGTGKSLDISNDPIAQKMLAAYNGGMSEDDLAKEITDSAAVPEEKKRRLGLLADITGSKPRVFDATTKVVPKTEPTPTPKPKQPSIGLDPFTGQVNSIERQRIQEAEQIVRGLNKILRQQEADVRLSESLSASEDYKKNAREKLADTKKRLVYANGELQKLKNAK